MREVHPQVYLIARPKIDWEEVAEYLRVIGGSSWLRRLGEHDDYEGLGFDVPDAEALVEIEGRLCYRSWEPGLNPNVTKIRTDREEYLQNILSSAHGSVLEHANFSFIFHDVSRVFTHELVRHRAGVAISQESMRFVRLTDIPFWFPDWAREDEELARRGRELLAELEKFQLWMADHFGLDDPAVSFTDKKHKTSFMRRFAPNGVATGIGWTANVRTLRYVIENRTQPGVEEEIRIVFRQVGEVMKEECPAFFSDFEDIDGALVPRWKKV